MPERDEVSVGWTVYEPVPFDAAHEGRGGVVIEVRRSGIDDGEVVQGVTTVKNHWGKLAWTELDADALDWPNAARPKAVELAPIIRMMAQSVGSERAPKMSDHSRRLLRLAAELEQRA